LCNSSNLVVACQRLGPEHLPSKPASVTNCCSRTPWSRCLRGNNVLGRPVQRQRTDGWKTCLAWLRFGASVLLLYCGSVVAAAASSAPVELDPRRGDIEVGEMSAWFGLERAAPMPSAVNGELPYHLLDAKASLPFGP